MVCQVIGEYEVKDLVLKAYNGLVKQLWTKFSQIQLIQIPHEENVRADELSRVDLFDPKATKGTLVEVLNRPSITEEHEVMIVDALDWRSPTIEYLKCPSGEVQLLSNVKHSGLCFAGFNLEVGSSSQSYSILSFSSPHHLGKNQHQQVSTLE